MFFLLTSSLKKQFKTILKINYLSELFKVPKGFEDSTKVFNNREVYQALLRSIFKVDN